MTHVLIAGRMHEAGLKLLQAVPRMTIQIVDGMGADDFAPLLPKTEALLIRTQPLTAAMIASAPQLKIVSRHGVGYDSIDTAALRMRNIPLTIVGDVNSRAVAEHTLMLMLSAARMTVGHDNAVRSDRWGLRNDFETRELDGQMLLLIGFGRIGRRVAILAQAFGMTVMAYDPAVSVADMAALSVAKIADFQKALAVADFVSLHVPLLGNALIGAKELAVMKPTAIVVNAARGGLVDEKALDEALRQRRIFAAGLDVLVSEPPAPDHFLLSNPHVILSPHSAGLTQSCAGRMAVAAAQNIIDYFAGSLDKKFVVI